MRVTTIARQPSASVMLLTSLALAALCRLPVAHAADFGAKTNGNWTAATTWTPNGGPPGASDNVYIGSTTPTGAAATATVLLTQNQQARYVYLGNGAGKSGTLNLGNFNLTANRLYLGLNGGAGAITRGTGSLNIGYVQLSGSALSMTENDRTFDLFLSNGSTVTTAATTNVSETAWVRSGSTLTLGADLSTRAAFNDNRYNIEISGMNSALDARGHKITANTLSIGWEVLNNAFGVPTDRVPGNHVVQLLNRGDLVNEFLFVANQSFNLTPTDQVWGFELANGSTNFGAGVGIARLGLSMGSTATTTEVGNITYAAFVESGSTLTLGADLNVGILGGSGRYVAVRGDNSTIDAQGHSITATSLILGWDTPSTTHLLNKGRLTVTELLVANQNFNLAPADQVSSFALANGSTNLGAGVTLQRLYLQDGATAATSAVGNITRTVEVTAGSTLTLGANLSVSEGINVWGGNSTINALGHTITASSLGLLDTNIQLLDDGAITVSGALTLAGGVQLELHDGNDTAQSLRLIQDSRLRIQSAATGFTITGTTASDLEFNGTSTLTLELDGTQPGWVLRWANPAGGDHIADLNALIAQDMILFSVTNGGEFNIVSQNGYTYIVQPVPEPGLILLIAAPIAVALCRDRRDLSRRGCEYQREFRKPPGKDVVA